MIGGFFLVTFYNWQGISNSNETSLIEKEPKQSASKQQVNTDKSEIAESMPNDIDDLEQVESSFNIASRENFQQEKAEVKKASSVNKEQRTDKKKAETKKVKPAKKTKSKKKLTKRKNSRQETF